MPGFRRQRSVVGAPSAGRREALLPRPPSLAGRGAGGDGVKGTVHFGYRSFFRNLVSVSLLALLPLGPLNPSGVAQTPPPLGSQSLLAQADALLYEMSEITGLPVKARLKKQIMARPDVRKYLEANLHAEYSPDELHAQQAALRAFGLVSRDFNLEKFLLDFYTEQAAGFYDPRRKTMYLADWVAEDTQRLVLTHELTHALEDQNFGLDKFLHADRANDDSTNARQAVVEGHATAAMMQDLVRPLDLTQVPSLAPLMGPIVHQQMEEFPAFTKAPFFFRFQALFPYAEGVGFMQRGLAAGGWKKLNALFTDPPRTTKEFFEPEFYFEHKPLPTLILPRPAVLTSVAGLHLVGENTLGELGYYALLGQLLSEEEAKSVTRGWMADRYLLYESPAEHYVLVARTLWSNPEAALAFFRDYHTILARKYPELTADTRSGTSLFIGSTTSGQVIVLGQGDEVRWVEGAAAAQADALIDWLRSLN